MKRVLRLLASRGDGGSRVVAYDSDIDPVTMLQGKTISIGDLKAVLDKFPNISELAVGVNDEVGPLWPECAEWVSAIGTRLEGVNILLDPGHSPGRPGAKGQGEDPPLEYDMNSLQARILAQGFQAEGAHVELYDPDPDDLIDVASRAEGKHLYLSLHHNALDQDDHDEGTEVYTHPRASAESKALGESIAKGVSHVLGIPNRGVRHASYAVLVESELRTNCPINLLVESYYLDAYSSVERARDMSSSAAYAILDAVVEYFQRRTNEDMEWMGVKTFARGADVQLAENFHLREFECLCGCSTTKVNGLHLNNLQYLRDTLDRPIKINSAYRCEKHNRAVGGARNSLHLSGCATDIVVSGMSAREVQRIAGWFDGMGRYAAFTHIDSRGYNARW